MIEKFLNSKNLKLEINFFGKFSMKKICVVIGSRANYSSIKSAMLAIDNHNDLELQVIITASALLNRYGNGRTDWEGWFQNKWENLFFTRRWNSIINGKIYRLGLIEISSVFERISPDIVITVGDRFETMSTTIAASYMNIPIAHTMGGEVLGQLMKV